MTTANRNIFDIAADLQALNDLLGEIGGDVTDEQVEAAFDRWFGEIQLERDKKLDGYAQLIRHLTAQAASIKDEIDRLRARKAATENKVARLKARLEAFMLINGEERMETDLYTFAIQKAGGRPKVVVSDYFAENPVELPEGLRRVKFEPDLDAIRDALETEPEEFKIYGYIAESAKVLRIR